MEVGGVNGGVIHFGLGFPREPTAAQVVQDTAVLLAEDAGLHGTATAQATLVSGTVNFAATGASAPAARGGIPK